MDRTEAQTRKNYIDVALTRAGWDVADNAKVGQEIPVDGSDAQAWNKLEQTLRALRQQGVTWNGQPPTGISDYVLYRPNGEILAVVEAKRTSVDPRIAQAQAQFYVEQIAKRQSFAPFAFMTNGYEIYYWETGIANKRRVAGFFTPQDLENRLYDRQNSASLSKTTISPEITNRTYQAEAIRRVCEAFESGKRRSLLVMATGTGKTRTVMSLIDVFLRAHQAQHILFVADRDALVKQAIGEGFQQFLPSEPCTRIHSLQIDTSQRLYAATLQTLSNCYAQFSPGFFDLIVFDEVHRSIFNRWNEVIQYFDARMVGLTATPADFIDRNTFLEFECTAGFPTFLYSYRDAINEGYLVHYHLYVAKTRFQRTGIRGVDLTEEERNQLIEAGIDPDNLDYSGSDIEKTVSNKDTLRKQWAEIMEVCLKDRSGQLPGKTIVFAMTQEHAMRLAEVFEAMYPQYPGLVEVITHKSDYKSTAIERFKKSDWPRIAISVDMLDTGVNVPEVVNLVFMKPVQSRIKLEQMIGRGTRNNDACMYPERLPNGHKDNFLVMDFWENDFNRSADKEQPQTLPILVSLFNTRLDLLESQLTIDSPDEKNRIIADLRRQITQIPCDSFLVKPQLHAIEPVFGDQFWLYLTADKLDFLRLSVGPLLRHAVATDVDAVTFTGKVERLKLQRNCNRNTDEIVRSITEDVSRLPAEIFHDAQLGPLVHLCLTGDLAHAPTPTLNRLIDELSSKMSQRTQRPNPFVALDLADLIETRGYIILTRRNEKVYIDDYRRMVDQRVLDLVANHPTIRAIEHNQAVTDAQLLDLERTLRHDLGESELELNELNIRKAYSLKVDSLMDFVRQHLEVEGLSDYQEILQRQFEQYIATSTFNADQIRFVRTVQSVLLRRHRLTQVELYQSPFSMFGLNAALTLFSGEEMQKMMAFVNQLAIG